jgi:hypothetical protein
LTILHFSWQLKVTIHLFVVRQLSYPSDIWAGPNNVRQPLLV